MTYKHFLIFVFSVCRRILTILLSKLECLGSLSLRHWEFLRVWNECLDDSCVNKTKIFYKKDDDDPIRKEPDFTGYLEIPLLFFYP